MPRKPHTRTTTKHPSSRPPNRPPNRHHRNTLIQSANTGAEALARWATTDHSRISDTLIHMPKLAFRDTVLYFLSALILRCLGLLGSLAMIYAMVFYGLPWFLFGSLP